jgi:exodeoxyribonuclease VII small subunit
MTFDQAKARLDEIVTAVRRKDASLEQSLDLLEEGVRLANICTERIDHTQWRSVVDAEATTAGSGDEGAESAEGAGADAAEDDAGSAAELAEEDAGS